MYRTPPTNLIDTFNVALSDFAVDGFSNYENLW